MHFLIRPRALPYTALLAATMTVGSCAAPTASSSSGRSRAGSVLGSIENAAASLVLPVAQEVALGKQVQDEFESQVKLHDNRELQAYVARVGKNVARTTKLPGNMKVDFHVVDDDKTINAVALPGGHIYVYTGLMKLMDDESELAGVLAHEVGHVAERHVAERLAKAYGMQLLASVALGGNPGAVKQIAAGLAANSAMMAFSRTDEREADLTGLKYMDKANYDAKGMVRVFEELGKAGGRGGVEFLQSHPLPENRVNYLSDAIRRDKETGGKTAKAEFQDMKSLL